MLDKKTIEIVKSTVPVLETHGEAITKRFYELMFTNHPELLNIFNHANQKQGRQQKALANAVYAAAKHIDQLEGIIPAVTQIGHKHRSLGILPEHYPIVGNHLILAIKDVLKDAATEEILEAWTKAYEVIANAFISVEKELYDEAETKDGGWEGFRKFKVWRKVKESEVITSFYLKASNGEKLANFIPGQYISVKVDIPGESYTHIRQYSLSDSPARDYYRISVKREPGNQSCPEGKVSNFLHSDIHEGSEIEISVPGGDFVFENTHHASVVLLSGGVGLTPMLSMVNQLAETKTEKQISFIHAAVNGEHHAFSEEVKNLAAKSANINYYFAYEKPLETDTKNEDFHHQGFITSAQLRKIVKDKNSIVYMCGPVPFMQAMFEALIEAGIKPENIHYEFFGPALQLKEPQKMA